MAFAPGPQKTTTTAACQPADPAARPAAIKAPANNGGAEDKSVAQVMKDDLKHAGEVRSGRGRARVCEDAADPSTQA